MSIFDAPETFLRKKELCDENESITYGAYLLFKKREDIMTTVELGCFQDKQGVMIKDSLRSKTNIVKQVDEVMSFVKKHINMAIVISPNQVENIQKWDYPLEAIREIVLNMIIHRDYRSAADSVVKILPDKMEFYNPGELPFGLSIEDLMSNNYSSRPRNKQIADVFKDMGDIEKYGSGIRRVCMMFEEAGFEKPKWEVSSGGILVTVFLKDVRHDTDSDTKNTISEKKESGISTSQKRILELLRGDGSLTLSQISVVLGINLRNTKSNMAKLKRMGLVERIGPAKGGYWKVLGTNKID